MSEGLTVTGVEHAGWATEHNNHGIDTGSKWIQFSHIGGEMWHSVGYV